MISSARILLDSSLPAPGWAHGVSCARRVLACDAVTRVATLCDGGEVVRTWDDPLEALAWMGRIEAMPDAGGRWVGFLGYDLGRLFEALPSRAAEDLGLPLFVFSYHDDAGDAESPGDASLLSSCWRDPPDGIVDEPQSFLAESTVVRSTFTRASYESAVARCIEYIGAGDIFQVNLSQRFTADVPAAPEMIYRRLLQRTPAWYGALLEYPGFSLISNSPELFLHVMPEVDGSRRVITRPIKGTRPRRPGMERVLRDSIKDQAELNMIIDLERNDLGRICRVGSVRVAQLRSIEAHPTVYHGVATVEGVLRPEVGFVDLLRATFPGGSITGAPKIRAMQIIDELEPVRRGPYCGAIGFLAANGEMQFNIAIRTMIATAGKVHIPVGGGIVADSIPGEEYEETLVKARAMFEAIGIGR